jgi:hypothetical protein
MSTFQNAGSPSSCGARAAASRAKENAVFQLPGNSWADAASYQQATLDGTPEGVE